MIDYAEKLRSVVTGLDKSSHKFTDVPLALIDKKQSFDDIDRLADFLFVLNREFDKFSFVISVGLKKAIDTNKSGDSPSIIKQGDIVEGSESIYIFKEGHEFWLSTNEKFKFRRLDCNNSSSGKYDLLYSTIKQDKAYVRALWVIPKK